MAVKVAKAFTLVEMLVSMALLVVIVVMVVQITNQTSQLWRNSTSRIQAFQEARAGFEAMTRKLSQATLNTYYDYYDANNNPRSLLTGTNLANFTPATYNRLSDLHFISGQAGTLLQSSSTAITTQTHAVFFQAPLGYSSSASYQQLDNALNACGYFLQFGTDQPFLPPYISSTAQRWRFRLMEMTQPTEQLGIYYNTATSAQNNWFLGSAATTGRMLAQNVIALVLLPKLTNIDDTSGVALAPNYNYNSRIPLGALTDAAWPSASPAFPPDAFTATPATGGSTALTRHHQLPPAMRVVMIVIDEASASRLQGSATTPPAAINLSHTTLFTNASNLDSDVQAVQNICNATPGNLTGNTQRLTYRTFNTEITMRDAKWSNN